MGQNNTNFLEGVQHMMKKKQERKTDRELMKAQSMMIHDLSSGDADPQGSYTGVPLDAMDLPVQDADDL
jgi:hypothetical protein